MKRDCLDALGDFLETRLHLAFEGAYLQPELGIDGMVTPAAPGFGPAEEIARIGPFSTGNAKLRFALGHARPCDDGRRTAFAVDATGTARIKTMLFRASDSGLGTALMNLRGATIHIGGKLRVNRWQGREETPLLGGRRCSGSRTMDMSRLYALPVYSRVRTKSARPLKRP